MLKSLAQNSHTMLDYNDDPDEYPEEYIPYQHLESEENIQTWTASTSTVTDSNTWWSSWATLSPLHALISGQKITGPYAMLFTFLTVFLFGIYCVKRCLLKRAASATVARHTITEARQARRAAMNMSYESSDGYSGSEMEFDQQSSSNYEQGDMSISFDGEDDLPADYH